MEDIDLTPLPISRDSVEINAKWYFKYHVIFALGILLGMLFNLCISAIINLTINPGLSREIFLTWQKIPVNVWVSIVSFVLFIIVIYYFKLFKNVK